MFAKSRSLVGGAYLDNDPIRCSRLPIPTILVWHSLLLVLLMSFRHLLFVQLGMLMSGSTHRVYADGQTGFICVCMSDL